ncbi:hypothetical protein A5847_001353 [Enterococcus faecium]|nr:hypothetical protein A5847_001353 [Enterococcus faecium]
MSLISNNPNIWSGYISITLNFKEDAYNQDILIEGKTQLWFKFDPLNRFIKDFYKVWDSEVFFLAIEDSLLINLYYSNKNYFKIPAAKTRMKKDVYFLFDVVTDVPDARSDHRRYDYLKYTFVDPERYKD